MAPKNKDNLRTFCRRGTLMSHHLFYFINIILYIFLIVVRPFDVFLNILHLKKLKKDQTLLLIISYFASHIYSNKSEILKDDKNDNYQFVYNYH